MPDEVGAHGGEIGVHCNRLEIQPVAAEAYFRGFLAELSRLDQAMIPEKAEDFIAGNFQLKITELQAAAVFGSLLDFIRVDIDANQVGRDGTFHRALAGTIGSGKDPQPRDSHEQRRTLITPPRVTLCLGLTALMTLRLPSAVVSTSMPSTTSITLRPATSALM
ncbi:hypothetical protein D3C85_1480270 [compost metagenome]